MSEPAHLTPEQLDDLVARTPAGAATSGAAEDPAAAHLAGCLDCTAAARTQLAVRTLLASGPDPGPMPAEVAERLDAALAGAAAATGATTSPTTAPPDDASEPSITTTGAPSGTVLPMQPVRARRLDRLSPATARVGKVLVGVAAAALIVTGGYAALHTSPRSSTASSAKSSDAGGSAHGSVTAPQASRPVQVQATGTAYTKANILAKVTDLLAGGVAAGTVRPGPNAAIESTLTTPAGLHACLQALGYGSVQPLLVDLATFEGKSEAVLVLPNGTRREVWVVSRDCAGPNDGTAYFATLP